LSKKIIITAVSSLILVSMLLWTIPVFAADSEIPSTQDLPRIGHVRVLPRLMLIQDEAKVDALLERLQSAGKLTEEQAGKIKNIWTQRHAQTVRHPILKLRRLLTAENEARVQQFLDKAVQTGKITQERADRLIQIWERLHTNNP